MPIAPAIADFWERFRSASSHVDDSRFYEVFSFGDNEMLANSLADLVLAGTKRATAGSVWSYEAQGTRPPEPGDLSVVTNWAGTPVCVIETERVDIVPFAEVTAEFAAVEGEGDGSLAYWRQAHTDFFSRECARAGRTFTQGMLVACERFKVVYRPSGCLPRRAGQVVLRRLRQDDLPTFHAYRADPVVGRYQGWVPMSQAECLAFIEQMALAALFEPGAWAQIAIARADDDTLIGDVGLFVALDLATAEVGFTVSPGAQGQGYGAAAVAAAIGLLLEQTAVPRVLGITDARNAASAKLLERVGMRRIESRQVVYKGEACTEWVYALDR